MIAKKIRASFKRQAPALVVALGATVALVAGGIATRWTINQRQAASSNLPVGVETIPQDAWMTITVSTEPGQWQELRQFGTPKAQEVVDKRLVEWRDRFLTTYGYNYQRDIQPWIGREVTLAFLPSTHTPANSTSPRLPTPPDPSLIMVLPIADVTRVQRILGESQTGGIRQWTTATYKGIQLRETRVNRQDLVIGVLGSQNLIVARDRKAVERAIDTYRGADSLAKAPGYRHLHPIAAARPFLRLYLNAAQVNAIVAANSIQAVPSWIFGFLQNNQGIAATVSFKADRIQIQGLGWLPADGDRRHEVKNTATRIPSLLPEDTLMMVSGGTIQQFWQAFNQTPMADPKSLSNPANLRQGIQETTGLVIEQDILPWLSGEFALALIPRTPSETGKQTVGVVVLAKASDRTAAENTLKRLDTVMGERYRFQVRESNMQAQPVISWVSPFGALMVTRGWLPDNVAFLTLGAPVTDTLLPAPRLPLTQRDRFRAATASDARSNNGQLFIDVARLTQTNNSIPIPHLPPTLEPFAEAIQAIGMTTVIQSERDIRYDINILVPKANNPRPLPQ